MRTRFLILGMILLTAISCNKGIENPHSANPSEALNTPTINYFTADPLQISAGFTSTLSWSVSNAVKVIIYCQPNTSSCDFGEVEMVGTREVSPGETTIYTLTAHDEDGSVSKSMTVEVDNQASRMEIEITTIPETVAFTYYPESDTSKATFTVVVTETAGIVGGAFDGEIRSFVSGRFATCWTLHLLEWRTIEPLGNVMYDVGLEVKCRDSVVQVYIDGIDKDGHRVQKLVDISLIWAN